MNLSKILLLLLLILITFGLIAPNGLRAAIANNLWSIRFVHGTAAQPAPKVHPHAGLLLAVQALQRDHLALAAAYLENTPPETLDRLERKTMADIYFLQGDVAEAVSIWKDLGLWYSLERASGALSGDLENSDARILALQAATDLFPERYARSLINATLNRAEAHRQAGEFEQAIARYQEIIDQFPDQAQAYAGLAAAYQQTDQIERALDAIEAGKTLNSKNKNFFTLAGELYEQAGKIDQALQAYQQVLTIDPQNPEALEAIQRLSPSP